MATDDSPEARVRATLTSRAARMGYDRMLGQYAARDMADVEAAIAEGASPEPLRAFVAEHGLDWDLQWTRSPLEIIADDVARAVGYAVRARQYEAQVEESRRASLFDLADIRARQAQRALMSGRQALYQGVKALHGEREARQGIAEACDAAALARSCETATRALERREAEQGATV